MKLIRRFASCLLVPVLLGSTAAPAAAQALPDAEPAMWVVKDADTTIYLFGTFHALDGKTDWFNDEVRDAFDASQEVVLEIITPENPAEMRPALLRHALTAPNSPTLSSKLSPEGRARLAAILAKNKMPPGALDRFRPFFASVTLASLQFGAMGMGVEQGAEAVIRRAMKGGNKQLGAVETVDEQFALLNALPEAEQLRIMESSLKEDGSMATEITSMLAAWNRGDAKAVAKAIQQSDKESPSLYKLMFTDRNARWAKWVDRRLDKPGTVFMAVGAGHLAGDRSLVTLLKKNGHRVSRVQ
jgi:uncharacterized protein YbaP (TraB family)